MVIILTKICSFALFVEQLLGAICPTQGRPPVDIETMTSVTRPAPQWDKEPSLASATAVIPAQSRLVNKCCYLDKAMVERTQWSTARLYLHRKLLQNADKAAGSSGGI